MRDGWLRISTGRSFFRYWTMKRRLAETRRPHLTDVLSVAVGLFGLYLVVQGIIVGWFIEHVIPLQYGSEFAGAGPAPWLAGALMILLGVMGVIAVFPLAARRRMGAYLAITCEVVLLVAGAVLVYSGIRYDAPWLLGAGALDLSGWVLLSVMVGLCWYTMDPLGLHWVVEQRWGKSSPAAVREQFGVDRADSVEEKELPGFLEV